MSSGGNPRETRFVLFPLKHPPCGEMMEFFSIAEFHLLFDPGSIRTNRCCAELEHFGYFACRTATAA
jgi:hypothetical protein